VGRWVGTVVTPPPRSGSSIPMDASSPVIPTLFPGHPRSHPPYLTMSHASSPEDKLRRSIWARVYKDLLHQAIPDSRFSYDFLSFTPDFRQSDSAIRHVAGLACYQAASTILVTPDNSLEGLRFRALQEGKRVLVSTYRMRRGFVLLDPAKIEERLWRYAACLDGMEKPGVGRAVTLAQLREEGVRVDVCATGALVLNRQGVVIWEGQALFEVQWSIFHDLGVVQTNTPVVAVAHACQVVEEAALGMESILPTKPGEVQCDLVVTPEGVLQVHGAVKPTEQMDFTRVDSDALDNLPPLQEWKGIKMMEQIMQQGGFKRSPEESRIPSAEEQMGIRIVEKLMKSHHTLPS